MNVMPLNCNGRSNRSVFSLLVLCTSFLLASPLLVVAQILPSSCGSLGRSFGPFDYRAERYIPESTYGSHKKLLSIVEGAHFTPEVEALIRGMTSRAPGGDITYTLNVFPNHHRALISMVALGEKDKKEKPEGSTYSIECWLQRAVSWRSDDHIVRMIYARYLMAAKRETEAVQQLGVAESKAGDNAFTHLNVGLIYFDMKNYEKALFHAIRAAELGFGNPILKEQLMSAGKWVEPTGTSPAEPAKISQ